jgi:hypothetical protein
MKKAIVFLAAMALVGAMVNATGQPTSCRISKLEKQAARIVSFQNHILRTQAETLQDQKSHQQAQAAISQLQDKVDDMQDKLFYAIAALVVLLAGLGVYVTMLNKKKEQAFSSKVLNLPVNEEGKPLREFIAEAAQQITSGQPAKIDEAALKEMVLPIVEQTLAQAQPPIEVAPEPPPAPSQVRYADSIRSDGFFNKVTEQPNADTVFELELENSTSAKFTVYEGAHSRVMKRPEFLPSVGCNKQVIGCSTLEAAPGKAQEQGGRWKVVSKVNVIIR